MKIKPGQVFYAANPANDARRIKVIEVRDYGKVQVVTVNEFGCELQERIIPASCFHATVLTRDGNSRRRGYILEK